jgi:hypothetical protein
MSRTVSLVDSVLDRIAVLVARRPRALSASDRLSAIHHKTSRTNQVKEPGQETIEGFAKRNDSSVMRITLAFALGGAIMDIGAHAISSMFMKGGGFSGLWGLWVPLCFITIPPIHYLCRHVQNLQGRIDALESQLGDRRAA